MLRRCAWVAFLVACSGGSSSPGAATATSAPSAPLAPSAATAEPGPASSPGAAGQPAADDLGPLLQTVLDMPELVGFWHPDQPGRKPLRVAITEPVKSRPPLRMFGVPVEYVEPSAGGPHVVFGHVDRNGNDAHVGLSYPAEGVVARVELRRHDDAKWSVVKKSVSER